MASTKNITRLLQLWQQGDKDAENELIALVEEDLRRLIHAKLTREPGYLHSGTTAMFHELYVRLSQQNHQIEWRDRKQFFAFSARLLRQVLVDGFRAKTAQKRGSGIPDVVLRPELITHKQRNVDLLRLDDALKDLEKMDPLKSRVVELRFFGGLTMEETAAVLNLSAPTVKRYWRVARTWLLSYLQAEEALDTS